MTVEDQELLGGTACRLVMQGERVTRRFKEVKAEHR